MSVQRTMEHGELTEAKAIRLAQRGDAGAFERLYRLHSARVFSLCLRMLRNHDEAEDSTQEVFLCVFRKIQGFRGESAFSTWLHRVTVNTVLMRLRGTKAERARLSETAETDEAGNSRRELGGPDLRLEGSIDRVTLEKAIDRLSPRCKLMFVLYDIQGYAHREIAKIAGCSVGNTKSQLHKARTKLRQLLRQDASAAERLRSASQREAMGLASDPFLGHPEPCESL